MRAAKHPDAFDDTRPRRSACGWYSTAAHENSGLVYDVADEHFD
jgi:hypothetical protein